MLAARWQVTFVPVSGLHGDNIVEPSPNMAWYQGPTLLQAIDKLEPLKPHADSQKLRFTVQDVIDVPEVGTVAIGYALCSALTASPLAYTAVALAGGTRLAAGSHCSHGEVYCGDGISACCWAGCPLRVTYVRACGHRGGG